MLDKWDRMSCPRRKYGFRKKNGNGSVAAPWSKDEIILESASRCCCLPLSSIKWRREADPGWSKEEAEEEMDGRMESGMSRLVDTRAGVLVRKEEGR